MVKLMMVLPQVRQKMELLPHQYQSVHLYAESDPGSQKPAGIFNAPPSIGLKTSKVPVSNFLK